MNWLLRTSSALLAVALGACVLTPRLPPPPTLINTAAPVGFSPDVRLLTVDRNALLRKLPQWESDLRHAAGGGPVNMLVLSGGGAYGAFGAGALIGMSRARARPDFQLVTGVSAGALLAPFAFLGPAWDPALQKVFTEGAIEHLQPSMVWGTLGRVLFPQGLTGHNALAILVDKNITNQLIAAVARKAKTGSMLIIATTNLDDEETVLWNMGAIASHGGPAADKLFRQVLTASASVPGVFPPVLIRVQEGDRTYDEMDVDGSVTTPVFIGPIIAQMVPDAGAELAGADVYVIVNGRLAMRPAEVPVNTIDVLRRSFSAGLTYKTRDALGVIMALTRPNHMHLQMTYLPTVYPSGSFLDFHRAHLHQLFRYGERCAMAGQLWASVTASVERNVYGQNDIDHAASACPAAALAAGQ